MKVYVLATLDTKGTEAAWLCRRLGQLGIEAILVDTGCLGVPQVAADVSRAELFRRAGEDLGELIRKADRGTAVEAAAQGAEALVQAAHADGKLAGVLSIGGSAGTTIGTRAMRALPIGVPKLMVSTLASGPVRQYVGDKDVLMLNSVVDILGLNRISLRILANAAAAMAGLVSSPQRDQEESERPIVAATMFGVTTPCVERATEVLEENGFEVLVFHATGNGGEALEGLVREGWIAGVLDITTTELADELVGGVLSAGPNRLTAAGECGVPQVVSVGALDMVNFLGRASVPPAFAGRTFHRHNENVTLMRTTKAESSRLGAELGAKTARATGPTAILLPARGVSAIDREGEAFDDPVARRALFDAVRAHCDEVECAELDHHINDPEFAEAAAHRLIRMLEENE